jgi:hypothetical protein
VGWSRPGASPRSARRSSRRKPRGIVGTHGRVLLYCGNIWPANCVVPVEWHRLAGRVQLNRVRVLVARAFIRPDHLPIAPPPPAITVRSAATQLSQWPVCRHTLAVAPRPDCAAVARESRQKTGVASALARPVAPLARHDPGAQIRIVCHSRRVSDYFLLPIAILLQEHPVNVNVWGEFLRRSPNLNHRRARADAQLPGIPPVRIFQGDKPSRRTAVPGAARAVRATPPQRLSRATSRERTRSISGYRPARRPAQ